MTFTQNARVGNLLQAMDAEPDREFTSAEAAKIMDVSQGVVSPYVARALERGLFFRIQKEGRRVAYRKNPPPPQAEVAGPRNMVSTQTTANGWKPPRMDPPRGQQPIVTREPLPEPKGRVDAQIEPPAPPDVAPQRGTWDPHAVLAKLDILHPVESQHAEDEKASERANESLATKLQHRAQAATQLPAEPAEPAAPPAPADENLMVGNLIVSGSIVVGVEQPAPAAAEEPEPEPEDEQAAGDAYVNVRTGELVIVGLAPDDEGRVTVPPDLVSAIRRQIAWMAA